MYIDRHNMGETYAASSTNSSLFKLPLVYSDINFIPLVSFESIDVLLHVLFIFFNVVMREIKLLLLQRPTQYKDCSLLL